MKKKTPGKRAKGLAGEDVVELQARLAEVEETLRAIQSGEVDALVVSRPGGDQVFTLQGADTTYRFLVEEMNEGALLLEPGGTILYANARFAEMAGVALEEVSGGAWERLFVAEARAGLGRLLRQAKSRPVRDEFELGGAGGARRPVAVSLCSMQREGVQGVCAVVTDLTERKVAEAALRAANETLERRVAERTEQVRLEKEKLLALLNSIPDEVWFADAEGTMALVNPAASREFGEGFVQGKVEAVAGRAEVYRADGNPRLVEEAPPLRALKGEMVRGEEEIVRSPTRGDLRHRQINASPVKDGSGKIIGSVSVVRDITEGKRAEEALQESEAMLARAQQVANLGSWQWDIATDHLTWSEQIYGIFGLSPEQFKPSYETFLSAVSPEDRAKVSKAVEAALAGEPYELEFCVTRPDGEQRNVLAQGEVDFDKSGKPVRMIGTTLDITERKRAEEAVQASERHYRRLVETAQEGIWLIDAQGNTTFANAMMCELLGYTAEEMAGRHLFEFLDKEARSQAQRYLGRRERGIREQHEFRFRRKDGTDLWTMVSTNPLFDANGKHTDSLAMVTDITERKRAEEALRASRSQLQDIIDNTPAIVYAFDPEGCFLLANRAVAQLLNCTPEQMIGKRRHEFMPKEDADWHDANDRKVFEAGRALEFEERSQLPGRSITWLTTKFPLRDAQGKIYSVAGISADISERKRAEEALRESEERLRLAYQGAKLGAFEWNLQTGVNVWTPELEAMHGLAPGAFARTQAAWEQRVHPEDRMRAVADVNKAFETEEAVQGEWRVVWPDGSVHWLTGRFQVFKDSAGKPLFLSGVNMDITERKEAEAVLKRDKEELERLVAERTSKLHELIGELEHFSNTITHDLKSPLRAMRSLSNLMLTDTCGACDRVEAKGFLKRISTSAERMDHVIADALSYNRSMREELPLEDVDADALLRGMLDSYPELQPDKAQIRVEGRLPVVLANTAGLTQCFSNLLGNAVKYVKPGELPDIRVWAEPLPSQPSTLDPQPGQWVRMWVEDKGIGIAPKMLPRVFDMFTRGRTDYEGTGIGLALVRKVAQRMGGKVGVESEEGKGSRFWIELKSGERESALA